MFCPKCGQWNAGSAAQCTACGTSLLPSGLDNASSAAPPQPAPTVPAVPAQPTLPPMPMSAPQAQTQTPSSSNSAPPAYPGAVPTQTAYPPYMPPSAPNYQPAPPAYSNAPQPTSYPAYPQQPYPSAPPAPGSAPSAFPSYSPLPPGSTYGAPAPYAFNTGYPTQVQQALNQCKVCGSMVAYGMLSCGICTVPVGMIANPHDPTVTTYLDARALNLPGTSPVYAAPGAYAGQPANPWSAVPDEAKRGWNWAAALNSMLWAFTHRAAGWGLVCATGLFLWVMMILGISTMTAADRHGTGTDSADATMGAIIVAGVVLFWVIKTLYLGSKGNAIAWGSGRYANISQMKNVQRQWTSWSIVVFFVAAAVLITATVIAGSH
jgi:hypothetical protein